MAWRRVKLGLVLAAAAGAAATIVPLDDEGTANAGNPCTLAEVSRLETECLSYKDPLLRPRYKSDRDNGAYNRLHDAYGCLKKLADDCLTAPMSGCDDARTSFGKCADDFSDLELRVGGQEKFACGALKECRFVLDSKRGPEYDACDRRYKKASCDAVLKKVSPGPTASPTSQPTAPPSVAPTATPAAPSATPSAGKPPGVRARFEIGADGATWDLSQFRSRMQPTNGATLHDAAGHTPCASGHCTYAGFDSPSLEISGGGSARAVLVTPNVDWGLGFSAVAGGPDVSWMLSGLIDATGLSRSLSLYPLRAIRLRAAARFSGLHLSFSPEERPIRFATSSGRGAVIPRDRAELSGTLFLVGAEAGVELRLVPRLVLDVSLGIMGDPLEDLRTLGWMVPLSLRYAFAADW